MAGQASAVIDPLDMHLYSIHHWTALRAEQQVHFLSVLFTGTQDTRVLEAQLLFLHVL
jgi:hypothetical protein